jgi:hypothetical protein
MLRRRELLGGAAAWPLAARAQRPGKLPRVGYLGSSTASAQNLWVAAFVRRLHELNWIEGRTIAIEYRWAEGRKERFHEIAAEFARLKVDVIVTALISLILTPVTLILPSCARRRFPSGTILRPAARLRQRLARLLGHQLAIFRVLPAAATFDVARMNACGTAGLRSSAEAL